MKFVINVVALVIPFLVSCGGAQAPAENPQTPAAPANEPGSETTPHGGTVTVRLPVIVPSAPA